MSNFTVGLDLGQQRDFSALAIVERVHAFDAREHPGDLIDEGPWQQNDSYWYEGARVFDTYLVRELRRWPLRTSYVDVVSDVSSIMLAPELRHAAMLVMDYGGVGAAVEDMFVECFRSGGLGDHWPVRVTLSGGFAAAGSRGASSHKGDVIAKLLAASQRGRVAIPEEHPLAGALKRELRNFTLKQTKAGNVQFEARRESDHDDLLLAVALGVWHWHRHGEPRFVSAQGELEEKPWAVATHPE